MPRRGAVGPRLRFGRGHEVRTGQTGVSGERPAAVGAERFGRQCGGFVAAVGLAEEAQADAEAVEPVGGREQVALRADAAEDEVGVGSVRAEEAAGGLDGRVRGLHDDLRGGQVPPDEDVQVFNLGEGGVHPVFASG